MLGSIISTGPRAVALEGAACIGQTELMFSEGAADVAAAVGICATCTARAACLERAVANGEIYGVWSGVLFKRGTASRVKRERLAS